jgi:Putative beta-barrel porin 2
MSRTHPDFASSITDRCRSALLGFGIACSSTIPAFGQESIRPSSTSAAAAEARKQPPGPMNYNLKAGPVTLDASTGMEIEFNDNVGLSENQRESDVIFRPEVRIQSEWRMTRLNTLRFDLGIGLAKYANHSNLDSRSVLLDPGSGLSFDLYIGENLRLNFHDRFAIVQNPADEPSLSNTARFDRFQNAAGITATWDLNDLDLVFGYDHFDYRTFGDQFKFLDRREEQFFASASLRMSDALTVGVESSFALVDYKEDFNNNGTNWSAGPFMDVALSLYTKARLSAGYQGMNFDGSGTNGDPQEFSGWYANLALAQRFNQHWSHSLNLGHEARLGLTVNFAEYTYARYVAEWRVNSRLNFAFDAFVEDANESGGDQQFSEHLLRYGAGAGLSWKLGSKISLGLRYRYVLKNSNLPLRDYYQNVGIVSVSYDF